MSIKKIYFKFNVSINLFIKLFLIFNLSWDTGH
jgi:hypothetical protein